MRFSRLICLLVVVCAPSSLSTGLLEEQSPLVTVRVREGGSAVLECQPRQRRDISEQHRQGSAKQHRGDVTTTVVEWVSRNHVLPVFLKLGIHPPRIDAAYLGRLRLQKGASLCVEPVRREDEGWYQCRLLFLTNPQGDHNGSWVHLSVTTPPSLRSTPPAVLEVGLGESVVLGVPGGRSAGAGGEVVEGQERDASRRCPVTQGAGPGEWWGAGDPIHRGLEPGSVHV
ncbi:protein turtle homolog A-like [Leucoraja erinacea]|uniref:protein turtle homolog A-like n=1 Tax=Leucoraja erinaceus TaxID=7782 RepID=UPI0024566F81|nr:protein turtle homolog A-like [Leucoraja erinacea]